MTNDQWVFSIAPDCHLWALGKKVAKFCSSIPLANGKFLTLQQCRAVSDHFLKQQKLWLYLRQTVEHSWFQVSLHSFKHYHPPTGFPLSAPARRKRVWVAVSNSFSPWDTGKWICCHSCGCFSEWAVKDLSVLSSSLPCFETSVLLSSTRMSQTTPQAEVSLSFNLQFREFALKRIRFIWFWNQMA